MMFAKLLLIFAAACGIHVACTSPTSAAPKERRMLKLNDLLTLGPAMNMYRYTCWIHGLIESLILILPALARQCPQSDTIQRINGIFFELVLPPSVGEETNIFFPPPRILGAFLLLSGSTIRYWCFRELGRHFTFDVALLENHSLVTTGPYSIVRHPSYSGGVLLTTGSILWHATSGSWLIQSRFYTNPIAWVMFIPAIIVTGGSIIVGVVIRPEKEDELLEKEFGKKWEEWARRVRYQLFPGIY